MADSGWQRRKILIWGKTRPELSKKYREIVCTGGIFQDTKKFVRLYPIPLRYMDSNKIFQKYQWIEAYVTKSVSDPRPESYKIRADGISLQEKIPIIQGDWSERASWIFIEHNIFPSVEAIQERQEIDCTSLGLVKPLVVDDVVAHKYEATEREKFWTNYKKALEQMDLPIDMPSGRQIKPLVPPEYRFKIHFRCNDLRCKGNHEFSVLDWEIDALYFTCRSRGDTAKGAAAKVVDKLKNNVCAGDKDLYFFLGNISTHQQIFTIVGLWWPKIKLRNRELTDQPELFEAL